MRDLIKEAIADLKKSEGFIYKTAEGKKIDLHEAAARGIAVTPVNPKDDVIKKLEAAGLFLTDGKFLSDFNELVSLISGGSVAKISKRRTFTDGEKSKIISEWKKVEAAGNKTKAAFAREIGIGYQTFINWLRG